MIGQISRLLDPLKAAIRNLAVKGLVRLVDEAQGLQELQVEVFADDPMDGVERFQNYGFYSNPDDGAEAVILNLGGNWDHPIVIVADDRRYRPKLAKGEVRVHHKSGQYLSITDEGVTLSAKKFGIQIGSKTYDWAKFIETFNSHTHGNNGASPPGTPL